MIDSESHFNKIADDYDFWKKKNWYYYQNLITLYQEFIPENSSVLEIGCGTGHIIAALSPKVGRGIDISEHMIHIARQKYADKNNLTFERRDIFENDNLFPERNIFLADVLEHVPTERFIYQISKRAKEESEIIVSVANPLWEPLLMLAEKLKMKMPEGPHERLSIKKTEKIFKDAGFNITKKDYRLLIPKKIIGSDFVNKHFFKLPFVQKFGFIVFWKIRKSI